MVLTSIPTTSFPYVEETTEWPISSASQILAQQNIFARYREIKRKNEALKASTYSEFWKETATTQHRFLSIFDTEKGQLSFLEPTVPTPISAEDYKASIFSVDTNKVHAIDQIDLHKQAREMIYSTLTSLAMAASKLQNL